MRSMSARWRIRRQMDARRHRNSSVAGTPFSTSWPTTRAERGRSDGSYAGEVAGLPAL